MGILFGLFLAALSVTGFAAKFVFGGALTKTCGVAPEVLPFGDFAWPSTPKAWGLVVGLGLVSTLMPFWTWNAAQRYLRTSTLAMTAYFTPVIAMGMGVAFLVEGVTALQWLGTAFIVASAVIETGRHDK